MPSVEHCNSEILRSPSVNLSCHRSCSATAGVNVPWTFPRNHPYPIKYSKVPQIRTALDQVRSLSSGEPGLPLPQPYPFPRTWKRKYRRLCIFSKGEPPSWNIWYPQYGLVFDHHRSSGGSRHGPRPQCLLPLGSELLSENEKSKVAHLTWST